MNEVLSATANELQEELYKLPNVPAEIVPEGKSADDNINVYQSGEIPALFEGALPHWELIKNMILLISN